ncbi:MAG: DnaA/Hda family protein [Gemmatimonadota bacterium]
MELDPRLTFDTFVVGPANRLAAAAARRAAESPGTSYNPLFVYSASGLGKSHILHAIAHHSARIHPQHRVVYQPLEGYLGDLTRALEAGDEETMRARYRELDILLLDDVQFLTGQAQAQELLLRTLDTLTGSGSQVVLASDRPPAEINQLDARLLSRFSGGLIVDMGVPDFETRVAIIRRKAEQRGAELAPGVSDIMARTPYRNVRELQGALNRILAVQELEDRPMNPEEVAAILGEGPPGGGSGETEEVVATDVVTGDEDAVHHFLEEVSREVRGRGLPPEEPWRKALRTAAEAAEDDGFVASRLRKLLEGDLPPEDPEGVAKEFKDAVDRLRAIQAELAEVGNPWGEEVVGVVQDPDRLEEAEALLASARERMRPFPPIRSGPDLEGLRDSLPALAHRGAQRLVQEATPDYSPLYVIYPDEEVGQRFLEAMGRSYLQSHPQARVALVKASDFAQDFIRAISQGVAGAWRERWWSADLLLFLEVETLATTERAQEEFFHLFEALKRQGGRLVVAGSEAPGTLMGLEDRLRSRFEGGLVVDLLRAQAPPVAVPPATQETAPERMERPERVAPERVTPERVADAEPSETNPEPQDAMASLLAEVEKGGGGQGLDVPWDTDSSPIWAPSWEKVVLEWPHLDDRLAEEG